MSVVVPRLGYTVRIDIFSDLACPWCYIGLTRFNRVLAGFEHGDEVSVELHSFQLDPGLPETYDGTETQYLASRKGLPEEAIRRMFGQVRGAATSEAITLDFDALRVANSWRAHRLIHAARRVDAATALAVKLALFRAHFTDGESISDPHLLRRIAAAHGVPENLADRAATGASRRPMDGGDDLDRAIVADLDQASAYGIAGVPYFVFIDKYGVSGAQPAEAFEQILEQVWAEAHPAPVPLTGLPVGAGGPSCGIDGCS